MYNEPPKVILPTMTFDEAEWIFYEYVLQVQVTFPISKRFGNVGDGGWNVCLQPPYELKKPCLVYSFGINDEWSFDYAIVKERDCKVRAVDSSMLFVGDHKRGTNIWFYALGLSGRDSLPTYPGWKMRTIPTILKPPPYM